MAKIAVAGPGYVGMSIATLLAQHNDLGFVFERSENMKQCFVLPLHE